MHAIMNVNTLPWW